MPVSWQTKMLLVMFDDCAYFWKQKWTWNTTPYSKVVDFRLEPSYRPDWWPKRCPKITCVFSMCGLCLLLSLFFVYVFAPFHIQRGMDYVRMGSILTCRDESIRTDWKARESENCFRASYYSRGKSGSSVPSNSNSNSNGNSYSCRQSIYLAPN